MLDPALGHRWPVAATAAATVTSECPQTTQLPSIQIQLQVDVMCVLGCQKEVHFPGSGDAVVLPK